MLHRHLNHSGFTLAAIDDVIDRGLARDWADLRNAVIAHPSVAAQLQMLLRQKPVDISDQRTMFWRLYAQNRLA